MHLPSSILILGILGVVFFVILTVWSIFYPGIDAQGHPADKQSPIIVLYFIGFSMLGGMLIIAYCRERHYFDSSRLRYRTLTQRGEIGWNEISRIRYSQSAKWFRLETEGGRVVRLSALLTGLQDFARTALATVPNDRIDPDTRNLLVDTASGDLPTVWR